MLLSSFVHCGPYSIAFKIDWSTGLVDWWIVSLTSFLFPPLCFCFDCCVLFSSSSFSSSSLVLFFRIQSAGRSRRSWAWPSLLHHSYPHTQHTDSLPNIALFLFYHYMSQKLDAGNSNAGRERSDVLNKLQGGQVRKGRKGKETKWKTGKKGSGTETNIWVYIICYILSFLPSGYPCFILSLLRSFLFFFLCFSFRSASISSLLNHNHHHSLAASPAAKTLRRGEESAEYQEQGEEDHYQMH